MTEKTEKYVLNVDDDEDICRELARSFEAFNKKPDCPYSFVVDKALNATECIQRVRTTTFDVITLDINMEGGVPAAAGLGVNLMLALAEVFSPDKSVRIIVTNYTDMRWAIEAIRHGAWDYIVKDQGGQAVVESAVTRLRQLDCRRQMEERVAQWLPRYFFRFKDQYPGKLLALGERYGQIIADGCDAFELEGDERLKKWRSEHPVWEPFIVKMPSHRNAQEV